MNVKFWERKKSLFNKIITFNYFFSWYCLREHTFKQWNVFEVTRKIKTCSLNCKLRWAHKKYLTVLTLQKNKIKYIYVLFYNILEKTCHFLLTTLILITHVISWHLCALPVLKWESVKPQFSGTEAVILLYLEPLHSWSKTCICMSSIVAAICLYISLNCLKPKGTQ